MTALPLSERRCLRCVRPCGSLPKKSSRLLTRFTSSAIRNIVGGPAPERTAEALAQALSEQREIDTWIEDRTTLLDDAQARLRQQVTDQP